MFQRSRRDLGSAQPAGVAMSLDEFAHQTIDAPQTTYQNALADALEKIFSGGTHDLSAVIGALNEAGIKAPDGAAWTEESFRSVVETAGDAVISIK